jgi:hypothetical protein
MVSVRCGWAGKKYPLPARHKTAQPNPIPAASLVPLLSPRAAPPPRALRFALGAATAQGASGASALGASPAMARPVCPAHRCNESSRCREEPRRKLRRLGQGDEDQDPGRRLSSSPSSPTSPLIRGETWQQERHGATERRRQEAHAWATAAASAGLGDGGAHR